MATRWFLARDNNVKYGPYTLEQLREYARMGRLQPGDMLLQEGARQWIPASSLAGLFDPVQLHPSPPREKEVSVLPPTKTSERGEPSNGRRLPPTKPSSRSGLWLVLGIALGLCVPFAAILACCGIAGFFSSLTEAVPSQNGAVALATKGSDKHPLVEKPPVDKRAEPTWQYWRQLQAIDASGPAAAADKEKVKSAAEVSAALQRQATVCGKMRTALGALSVENVDEEAVAFVVQEMELLGQAEVLFGDLGNYILEVQQYKTYAGSFEAGADAFVRGFLGDPLGKLKENDAKMQQFEARRLKLLERIQSLDEKGKKLDAQRLSIRASLTRKYGREFP